MRLMKKLFHMPMRIQSKIMLSLLAVALIMILYTSIVSFQLASDKVKEVSLRLSESNTASAVSALNNSLNDVHELSVQFINIQALQSVARSQDLRTIPDDLFVSYQEEIAQAVLMLKANAAAYGYGPKFEFISVQMKNGYSYTSQFDDVLPFSDYETCIQYFSDQNKKSAYDYTSPQWLLCQVGGDAGNKSVLTYLRFLYRPVTLEKLGVIVFGISEEWVSETYLPYEQDACLMTKSGILYSASGDSSLIGTPYNQNASLLHAIQEKSTSAASSIAYEGGSGKPQIASYQQLTAMQAYLIVPFDLYEGISSKEMRSFLNAVIIMGVFGLAATAVLSHLLSYGLSKSVVTLTDFTKSVERGETSLRYQPHGQDEIAYLGQQINDMLDQLQIAADQREADLKANQELELQLNQIQINPHLLYNTLDSALWILQCGRTSDVSMLIASMSEFLKISLSKGEMRIPLSHELDLIRHYLNIQKIARQKNIRLEIEMDEALSRAEIIKLTLQPLVENSIVHGFSGYRDDGAIRIHVQRCGDDMLIRISDNGIGMLPEEVDTLNHILQLPSLPTYFHHFGMFNVNRRIVQAFGQRYGIKIESEVGEHTTIDIVVPYSQSKSQEELNV